MGWALTGFGSTHSTSAEFLCDSVLGAKTYGYADHFAPSFMAAIAEADFRQLAADLREAAGDCTQNKVVTETETAASYDLISAAGHRARSQFALDGQGKIVSLRFTEFERNAPLTNFDDARTYLGSLRGQTSSTLSVFGGALESAKGSDRQPLGSGFKLYVLAALDSAVKAGTAKWDEKLAVKDEWKSLPSGTMHTLKAGTELTLQQYATQMISISDNTATDHLIRRLGREKVEAELTSLANPFPALNKPFLTTLELFKLKWGAAPAVTDSFVAASEADRRQLLATTIATLPIANIGTNGASFTTPNRIRDLEWFGSTDGQCSAMEKLHDRKSAEIEAVLSVNQPLVQKGEFKYAGFKGGSEPGVLTLTYLLQGQAGKWGCLSFAWNDDAKAVNQWIWLDYMQKALKLAEKAL